MATVQSSAIIDLITPPPSPSEDERTDDASQGSNNDKSEFHPGNVPFKGWCDELDNAHTMFEFETEVYVPRWCFFVASGRLHRSGMVEQYMALRHYVMYGGKHMITHNLYETSQTHRNEALDPVVDNIHFPWWFTVDGSAFSFLKPNQHIRITDADDDTENHEVTTGLYDTMFVACYFYEPTVLVLHRGDYMFGLCVMYDWDSTLIINDSSDFYDLYDSDPSQRQTYSDTNYTEIDYAHILWAKLRCHARVVGRVSLCLMDLYHSIFDPDKQRAFKRAKHSFEQATSEQINYVLEG